MIERYLNNILDVPGAEGLCLMDRQGKLLVSRMPDYVIPDVYENLIRRILALYEAIDEHFIPCDDYLLKYPQKWLFLRRTEQTILLVMGDVRINVMSLRMVTNMALKNISSQMLAAIPAQPAAINPSAPMVTAVPPLHPVAAPQPQMPQFTAPTRSPTPAVPAPVAATAEEPEDAETQGNGLSRNRVPRLERPPTARTYRGQTY